MSGSLFTEVIEVYNLKSLLVRESSFNITRGGGGGRDEEIETRSFKF